MISQTVTLQNIIITLGKNIIEGMIRFSDIEKQPLFELRCTELLREKYQKEIAYQVSELPIFDINKTPCYKYHLPAIGWINFIIVEDNIFELKLIN